MAKDGFTLEEHRELGAVLCDLRDQLGKWHIRLASTYPQHEKAVREILKAYKAVDEARSAMDDALFREHSGALPSDELMGIYYGQEDLR